LPHRVEFTEAALRVLRKLPRDAQRRIVVRAEALQGDPRPRGSEKLQTRLALYRVRSGDYRVVYRIVDSTNVVTIAMVGDRKDVHRWLERL
jgi:mRNA interferase RelE/StbE